MRTAVVLAMALVGAAGQGEPRALAGTWVADFAGRTFVRLELHETNGTWTGRISRGGEYRVDVARAAAYCDPEVTYVLTIGVR